MSILATVFISICTFAGTFFLASFINSKCKSGNILLKFKIKIAQNSAEDLKTICKNECDVIDVPGSIIGKFIRIRARHIGEDTILGEGIVMATHLSQISGKLAICIKLFTKDKEIETVNIPVTQDRSNNIYIETERVSDGVRYSREGDILKDLSNFCNNQCIFDCKDCSIAKWRTKS